MAEPKLREGLETLGAARLAFLEKGERDIKLGAVGAEVEVAIMAEVEGVEWRVVECPMLVGGGGGSGYTDKVTSGSSSSGVNRGYGRARITFLDENT